MPKLSQDIEFSQVYYYYLFVIVYCIYTPTGMREDLWETACEETPKYLSA